MKREGVSTLPFSRALAAPAPRQAQAPLRARQADVHEPALLVDIACGDRLAVRQHALLQSDQEDMRELEALGRVQGRQPDRVRLAALFAFEQGQ